MKENPYLITPTHGIDPTGVPQRFPVVFKFGFSGAVSGFASDNPFLWCDPGLIFGASILLAICWCGGTLRVRSILILLFTSTIGYQVAVGLTLKMAGSEILGPAVASVIGMVPLAIAFTFIYSMGRKILCVSSILLAACVAGLAFFEITDIKNMLPGLWFFFPINYIFWQCLVASTMGLNTTFAAGHQRAG